MATTWLPADLDDLHRLHSDPELMRWVRHGRPETRQESESLLGRYLDEQHHHGRTKWRLVDEHGVFVGRAGFGRSGAAWELGYTLRRDRWGAGLATEIATALVEWHRDRAGSGAAGLIAYAAEANTASLRVLGKAGLVRTGSADHNGMACAVFELLDRHVRGGRAPRSALTGGSTGADTDVMTDSQDRLRDDRDIAALMTGWIHRDTASWDALGALFHPDATIAITWFDGPAADFVRASATMGTSDLRTKHLVASPLITYSDTGDRAVVETNAMIVGENRTLSLGTTTHNRFLDHVERRAGRWAIVRRDSVYDFSSFTFPFGPDVDIDRALVESFPIEYASLAYLLTRSGFPVTGEFAVQGGEREHALRADGLRWLSGSG